MRHGQLRQYRPKHRLCAIQQKNAVAAHIEPATAGKSLGWRTPAEAAAESLSTIASSSSTVLRRPSLESQAVTSDDFRDALKKHGIDCSMSARGNCYDNAVVESFFGLLKRERVNRTRYLTREEAQADVFDYIERFYKLRRHGYLGNICPAAFEERTKVQFQTDF